MQCKHVSEFLLVLAATVLMGCGTAVQFVPVDARIYEPRPKDHHILVYTSAVHEPHVVLGTLTVEKKMDAVYGGMSTYDLMVEMLQDEARKIGGDALVNIHPVDNNERVDMTVILTARVVRYLEHQGTIRVQ